MNNEQMEGVCKMSVTHNPQLTASEIAALWGGYFENTLGIGMLKYFLKTVEDPDMIPLFEQALRNLNQHVSSIQRIFTKENIPLPIGFTDQDVNLSAPRLYSDIFMCRYLKHFSRVSMMTCATAKALTGRSDVREILTICLEHASDIYDRLVDLMLEKGIYVRSPIIEYPKKADVVHRENFLAGLLAKNRPVTAIEITHLGMNIETNMIGKTLLIGFSQVADHQKIREYFVRGRDIATKHVEVFTSFLQKDQVNTPSTWESAVSSSTVAPFSDKLMMYHVSMLNTAGTGNYGASIAGSMRTDISAAYTRLMAEVGRYAVDGAKLMIDHEWMEKPPQAPDRDALARV